MDESVFYLNKDLKSLYEVLVKANKQFFLAFNIQMTNYLTIYRIAL